MYSSLLEAFDAPISSSAAITYKDNNIAALCQNNTLDSDRKAFIGTFKNLVNKLNDIDSSVTNLNDKMYNYQTQLIRINDVNDSLINMIGFFSGDANGIQLLSNIADNLTKSQVNDSSNLNLTRNVISSSELLVKKLYALTSKLDNIRKHLINISNIYNRNVSQSKVLCLKKAFLDPGLYRQAVDVDNQIQSYLVQFNVWCSKMNTYSATDSRCQTSGDANICSTDPNVSLSKCSDDDCYKNFMSRYNPTALPDQWKDFKTCATTAAASPSGIRTCTDDLVYKGCIEPSGFVPVGPVKSTCSPQNPGLSSMQPAVLSPAGAIPGMDNGNVKATKNTYTGVCADLYNKCITAGGSPDVCDKLASDCASMPTEFCPPAPPKCGPGIGDCPDSKMTWNVTKKEYEITSHPDMPQWGVQNNLWNGGSQWLPDYVAQKMGVDNRCQKLNDFDISKHKDFVNFVPKTDLSTQQTRIDSLGQRLKKCVDAFDSSSCSFPAAANGVENFVDGIADQSSACSAPIDAGMTYDIKSHKQFQSVIKDYTPNTKLPQVCQNIVDCKSYPIENHTDISKYVLKSTIPSLQSTAPVSLKDHPDFPTYENTWQAKADLAAKTAADQANAACQTQIKDFASQDPCGNPTKCKALQDYKLEEHPGFAAYTQAWKDKMTEYAGRDKDGNIIKCKNIQDVRLEDIPAVAQLKSDMQAACQASITALGSVDNCGNPQKCKSLNEYDIRQHKDFSQYAPIESCLTEDKLSNYVPKDQCLTADSLSQYVPKDKCIVDFDGYVPQDQCLKSTDFAKFDVTRHPDIAKYVLKSSVPDLSKVDASLDECRRNLCDMKSKSAMTSSDLQKQTAACQTSITDAVTAAQQQYDNKIKEMEKAIKARNCKLQSAYEAKLEALAASKNQDSKPLSAFDISAHPDFKKYVSRADVLPCPTVPSESDVVQQVRQNVSKYLDDSSMSQLCQKSGFVKKPSGNDSCASHFVRASNSVYEGFENPSVSNQKPRYPSTHDPTGDASQWDVMNHKDYKYLDKTAGHMPKEECYGTYAFTDANGQPIPCNTAIKSEMSKCKKLGEYKISDHPQYQSALLQYGAVKDKCGKIVPAPHCPSLVRNACGDLVVKKEDPAKKCSTEAACDASLTKEKTRFNILLLRYKDLLKIVNESNKDKLQYRQQLDRLHQQLQHLRNSIDESQQTRARKEVTQVSQAAVSCPRDKPIPKIIESRYDSASDMGRFYTQGQSSRKPLVDDTDLTRPFASTVPGHGWNYS